MAKCEWIPLGGKTICNTTMIPLMWMGTRTRIAKHTNMHYYYSRRRVYKNCENAKSKSVISITFGSRCLHIGCRCSRAHTHAHTTHSQVHTCTKWMRSHSFIVHIHVCSFIVGLYVCVCCVVQLFWLINRIMAQPHADYTTNFSCYLRRTTFKCASIW